MGLIRLMHPAFLAALDGVMYPVILVYLDWPGETVRAHTNGGDITWGGATWRGVGKFGEIDVPSETPGLGADSAVLSLVGAPDDLFDLLEDPILNRPGEIYVGSTTEPWGNVLIGEPTPVFIGHMDSQRYRLRVEEKKSVQVIQVDIGSGPGARSKAAVLHSYEDQMAQYPGDTAGRHVINVEAETETLTFPA